jgi:hypothetical protein
LTFKIGGHHVIGLCMKFCLLGSCLDFSWVVFGGSYWTGGTSAYQLKLWEGFIGLSQFMVSWVLDSFSYPNCLWRWAVGWAMEPVLFFWAVTSGQGLNCVVVAYWGMQTGGQWGSQDKVEWWSVYRREEKDRSVGPSLSKQNRVYRQQYWFHQQFVSMFDKMNIIVAFCS